MMQLFTTQNATSWKDGASHSPPSEWNAESRAYDFFANDTLTYIGAAFSIGDVVKIMKSSNGYLTLVVNLGGTPITPTTDSQGNSIYTMPSATGALTIVVTIPTQGQATLYPAPMPHKVPQSPVTIIFD